MGMLVAYLLGILTAMKPENHSRRHSDYSTDANQRHSFPNGPLSVPFIPPALSDEDRTKKKKKERRKAIMFWVQIGSLIVLFVYAGFTILIWLTMRDANQIAQQSLRLIEYTYAAKIIVQIGFSGDGTANVGLENHGKLPTISLAEYEITLEELVSGKALKPTLAHSVTDRVPEGGAYRMPNHFHQIVGFTEGDLALYKASKEGVKINGTVRYDNGFGQVQQEPFCWVSIAFDVVPCDGVERRLRSLPGQ